MRNPDIPCGAGPRPAAASQAALPRSLAIVVLCILPAFSQSDDQSQRIHRLLVDWGGLTHYGSDDSELKPPQPGENRVVFLGDQITEDWTTFFPGKPYLNRGIRGQTSPQMLVRFRQDVIDLKPKVVVIQAGLNDLAGLTGPATEETIGDNLMSMVELAKFNGILVVLASVTPNPAPRMQGRITEVNDWIKDYAKHSGSVYLDYYSALVNKKELTRNGTVPNEAGYAMLAPLAEKAIAQALDRKGAQ